MTIIASLEWSAVLAGAGAFLAGLGATLSGMAALKVARRAQHEVDSHESDPADADGPSAG